MGEWMTRAVLGVGVLFQCGPLGCASGEPASERLGLLAQALVDPPGAPGAGCELFATQLQNGDVRYAISFTQPQAYVEVFVQQNGQQNLAKNITSSAVVSTNGRYTYSHVAPKSQYRSGDSIRARFYSYRAGQPGVFTPGPAASTWLPSFSYGQPACASASTSGCNGYISTLPNKDVRFSITLPGVQQYVEVFVRLNATQTVAQNIVASRVANADGTSTYSLVKPAGSYQPGDVLLTRFYSYQSGKPGVFSPGPQEQVWAPAFTVGAEDACATSCASDGSCRVSERLPLGVAPFELALAASRELVIGEGASVVGLPGARPPIVWNGGSLRTTVGARAITGSIYSNAPVTLGTSSQVKGYIKGAGSVTRGANSSVIGQVLSQSSVTTSLFERSLKASFGTQDVQAASGVTPLATGAYRDVVVKSGATLRLAAGRYDVRSLFVEAGGVVDAGRAGALLNVRTGLGLLGKVRSGTANESGLVLSYFGAAPLELRDVFEGSLIAEQASVRLLPTSTVRGSIRGSDIFLNPGARVEYRPPAVTVPLSAQPPSEEGRDGQVQAVGGDPRPETSREQPLELTTDNPYLSGGFTFEPEISASQEGKYSHKYTWSGLTDAHFSSTSYPGDNLEASARRIVYGGLPYDGSPLPSSPGFPTTAHWAFRGSQLIHGNTYRFGASMSPLDVDRTLQHRPLWIRLSHEVLVVPVVVAAWVYDRQPQEQAERRRAELVANFDFLPARGEAQFGYTSVEEQDPTRLMGTVQTPPDDIWSQCGIQFRVVGSFAIPRPPYFNPERCQNQSNSFAEDTAAIQAALSAARPDLAARWFGQGGVNPIVVQIGPLTCSNYFGNTITGGKAIEVNTKDWVSSNGTLLAHELGHALGLIGHRGSSGSGNLMSAGADSSDQALADFECSAARTVARGFRNALHEYDLDLGNIAPPTPLRPEQPWLGVPEALPRNPACCTIDGKASLGDALTCRLFNGTISPNADCQVCCATQDPATRDPGAPFFDIAPKFAEECSADRQLEQDQCDFICCKKGSTGSRMTRFQCLANNPATGFMPGTVLTGDDAATFCRQDPK